MTSRNGNRIWTKTVFSVTLYLGFLLASLALCSVWWAQGIPVGSPSEGKFLVENGGKQTTVSPVLWWTARICFPCLFAGVALLVVSPIGGLLAYFSGQEKYDRAEYRPIVLPICAAIIVLWSSTIIWTIYQVIRILVK